MLNKREREERGKKGRGGREGGRRDKERGREGPEFFCTAYEQM